MQRGTKAFTLIELLVVIAIIAILAAILFPVFAQAKLAAKKTVDLSNFKQTSLAIIMYCGDSDDTYPMSTFWNANAPFSSSYTWSSALCVGPYIKNLGIFHNPVDPNTVQQPLSYYGLPTTRPLGYQSFLANGITPYYTMFQSPQYPLGVPNPQGLMPSTTTMPPCTFGCASDTTTTATSAPQPATIVLLAGGNHEYYGNFLGCEPWINNEIDWCYQDYGIDEQWEISLFALAVPTDNYYLAWRKFANQSNFAFSDGHSKSMPPGAMTDPARWVINPPANDSFSG